MGFFDGPTIVTNGLVLSLDAADQNSYSGSGTTWSDLSGNNNSGSLVNGPTFSSGNGGSIVFDGVDDYVNCGNNSTVQITVGTISSWVKLSSIISGYRGILVKQTAWGLFARDGIFVTYDWGGGGDRSTGINIADGTWKNLIMSFTETIGSPSNNVILYLNGIAVLTTTVKHANNNVTLTIGSGAPSVTQIFNGNIANSVVYNRVLSPSEVLQNYNAQKSRFGL
jgi:hypothetical protein